MHEYEPQTDDKIQDKGGRLAPHAVKAVLQLMESHGFYFVGPELGQSHPLLQKAHSLCSTDSGFSLVQHRCLGHLDMSKAETEYCTCVPFPRPEILKFLTLRCKFTGPDCSVHSLPKKILLFTMTLVTVTSNRGKNLYRIQVSQMDAAGGGYIFQIKPVVRTGRQQTAKCGLSGGK